MQGRSPTVSAYAHCVTSAVNDPGLATAGWACNPFRLVLRKPQGGASIDGRAGTSRPSRHGVKEGNSMTTRFRFVAFVAALGALASFAFMGIAGAAPKGG